MPLFSKNFSILQKFSNCGIFTNRQNLVFILYSNNQMAFEMVGEGKLGEISVNMDHIANYFVLNLQRSYVMV